MLDMEFLQKQINEIMKDAKENKTKALYHEQKAREYNKIYDNKKALADNLYYVDIYNKKEHALQALKWTLQKYTAERYSETPYTVYVYNVRMALNYKYDFKQTKVKITERPNNKRQKWAVEVSIGEQIGNYIYFNGWHGVKVDTVAGLFDKKMFKTLEDAEKHALEMIDKLNFFIRQTELYLSYIHTVGTGIDELGELPKLADAKETK